ncbi:hypothetical protein SK128_001539 [Halocaridina rubra]|uniref:MOSC domain-containing protein n=1 Tax=Halocaridina rubra TaxID=373956 RepID=A0AAN8XFR7_HALRR
MFNIDPVPGLDCGDVAAQWLEKVLKKKARLLYQLTIPSPRRSQEFVEQYPLMKGDDNALYADQFPYMLMTRESVADLEERVNFPLSPQNFRPNILVEGSNKPYDEDDWAYIKIGDAIFRNLSPCSRCIFTTVHYKTGIKEPNMEPLRTLRTYRKTDDSNSPFFGLNLAIEIIGNISEQDFPKCDKFCPL